MCLNRNAPTYGNQENSGNESPGHLDESGSDDDQRQEAASESEEEMDGMVSPEEVDLDSKPITTPKKTFEQLLEEELRKEEERLQHGPRLETNQQLTAHTRGKKTFLKKGEGVARFGVNGKPPPPAARKKPEKKTSAKKQEKRVESQRVGERRGDTSAKGTEAARTQLPAKAPAKQPVRNKQEVRQAHTATQLLKLSMNKKLKFQKLPKQETDDVIDERGDEDGLQTKEKKKSRGRERKKVSRKEQLKAFLKTSPRDAVPPPQPEGPGVSKASPEMKEVVEVKTELSRDSKEQQQGNAVVTAVKSEASRKTSSEPKVKDENENEELEEFEILEGFAEDNVSFVSTVSAVKRAVQEQQQQQQRGTRPSQAASFSGGRPQPLLEQEGEEDTTLADDFDDEANSTLIESSPTKTLHVQHSPNFNDLRPSPSKLSPEVLKNSAKAKSSPDISTRLPVNQVIKKLALNHKLYSNGNLPGQDDEDYYGQQVYQEENFETRELQEEFGGLANHVPSVKFLSNHVPPVQPSANHAPSVQELTNQNSPEQEFPGAPLSQLPAGLSRRSPIGISQGKLSPREESFGRLSGEREDSATPSYSNSVRTVQRKIASHGHRVRAQMVEQPKFSEENEIEDVRERINSKQGYEAEQDELKQQQQHNNSFGDDMAWGDVSRGAEGVEEEDEEEEDEWENEFKKPHHEQHQHREMLNLSPPPVSALMGRLFPALKPEKKPEMTRQQEEQMAEVKKPQAEIDGQQAQLIRLKLAELEREIERFRTENATLEKLRSEREEGVTLLKQNMADFERERDTELRRIQEVKVEEMKKLKKEKRVFEEHQKILKDKPSKKDREEIEALKTQVTELQDELRRRETRWSASAARLRDRVEALETENTELKEEIRLLEKKRIEAWQIKEGGKASSRDIDRLAVTLPGIKHDDLGHPRSAALGATVPLMRAEQDLGQDKSHSKNKVHTAGNTRSQARKVEVTLPTSSSVRAYPERELKLRLSGDSGSAGQEENVLNTDGEYILPEDSASNISNDHASRPRSSLKHRHVESGSSRGSAAHSVSIASIIDKGNGQQQELAHSDGKIEHIYTNGARVLLFPNGTRKEISGDGLTTVVAFFNGDIKQVLPDKRTVYFYTEAQATQTSYPDGLEILQFPNGQLEKNFPDGTKEITFPDQSVKCMYPNGTEENLFPDGTKVRLEPNGQKTMQFPNGQKEVHTAQFKRREYPDGTIKTVYPDGRQETRYSNGRVRVKDRDGTLLVDQRM